MTSVGPHGSSKPTYIVEWRSQAGLTFAHRAVYSSREMAGVAIAKLGQRAFLGEFRLTLRDEEAGMTLSVWTDIAACGAWLRSEDSLPEARKTIWERDLQRQRRRNQLYRGIRGLIGKAEREALIRHASASELASIARRFLIGVD